MPRALSSISYEALTVNPDSCLIADVAVRPLPALTEPADMALVAHLTVEPLVEVTGPRIICLNAYLSTGWEHAHPTTLLRAGALTRLRAAALSLPDRFGLAVFDAWRPLALQQEIYTAAYADPTLPEGFVNPPSTDPRTPPPHLTGGTVDVTLTWDGQPLALGTLFDAFDDPAWTAHFESSPGRVRDLRRLLYWTMRDVGYVVLDQEWWHFEYGTRRWAALCGRRPLYGPAEPPDLNSEPAAA